jgi:hypothetical protein
MKQVNFSNVIDREAGLTFIRGVHSFADPRLKASEGAKWEALGTL